MENTSGLEKHRRSARFPRKGLIGYDPYVSQEELRSSGLDVEKVSLEDLFERSDIVSLHLKSTPETEGMIGHELLGRMKRDAYLINTSRAAVVDRQALYDLLAAERIGGAALDVFWEEPLPPEDPFRALPNVTLTPHLAGTVVDALPRSPFLLADVINDYWRTGHSKMQMNRF